MIDVSAENESIQQERWESLEVARLIRGLDFPYHPIFNGIILGKSLDDVNNMPIIHELSDNYLPPSITVVRTVIGISLNGEGPVEI